MAKRIVEIDIMKGLLTLVMVFGHLVWLLYSGQCKLFNVIIAYSELVGFSGFYFCFGFATWLAYLNKNSIAWPSALKTALKCYVAFFISATAYRILVSGQSIDMNLIFRVAALRDIPLYSEFLLSFSLVIIVACALAAVVRISSQNGRNFIIAMLVCAILTILLPKKVVYDPYIGLFIGGEGFHYFPIVQYIPLFLLGVYLARNRFNYNFIFAAISLVSIIAFTILRIVKVPISRFPPSIIWIVCSIGGVYICYGLGIMIKKYSPNLIKLYLNALGQNVLSYLVLSNLILFVCVAMGIKKSLKTLETLVFYIIIMAVLFFFQYISSDLKRANEDVRAYS